MNGETPRNRWWLVAASGIAVFMTQLDATVVNVAIPTIQEEMGIGPSLAQWVVLAYTLPLIALTVPSGRWLDGVGARTALVLSVSGFGVASALVGLAPGIVWLVVARALQGAFGAVLLALISLLATIAVREQARGRAMSLVLLLGGLGGMSGPVLGGLLIETLGWPWIFYLNVPACVLVIAIGMTQLPPGGRPHLPDRAWVAEAGLLGAAAVALLLALSLAGGSGAGWVALAAAAVPFMLVWLRLPGSRPVVDLLRAPGVAAPHLALLAEMAAVMAVQFLVPFHLQRVAGVAPAQIGLTMLAFPVAMLLTGPVGGALADRWDARRVARLGTVLVTAGIALIIPLGSGWGPADLAWRLAVVGAGAGLFAGPDQAMAMAATPRLLLGTTAATTSLARQLGVALGPALATGVWALAGYEPQGMRLAVALATALACASVLALTWPARRPTLRTTQ
ncbi:MFS transporter [Nonomuraea mesophila]|uniref:MFS transporter n=1 Tax=Nonomuraea mesophila TaxID=2530382 RepID=A0A4R5F8K6_9ACTN|nr:MFS transporter [Nonomuraea mesophila]TDE44535.1 MFS transporter [Nonomuraea mesophila]